MTEPCTTHQWKAIPSNMGRFRCEVCTNIGYHKSILSRTYDSYRDQPNLILPYHCPKCKGLTTRETRPCLKCEPLETGDPKTVLKWERLEGTGYVLLVNGYRTARIHKIKNGWKILFKNQTYPQVGNLDVTKATAELLVSTGTL